ncbi:ParB/Srx family N-terminal domain-containing protein [Undibacterium arcticum]
MQTSQCDQKVAITYRNTAELKPDPQNPRQHSRKQIRQIAASIKTFGFNTPVLIDGNDQIIAGHGRLLACEHLGRHDVPTICLDHLTSAQIRAFMIADNRLTENATWDDQLLATQLKELSLLELDFSLEVTGFDMGEIDLRIEGLITSGEAAGADDAADAVPVPSAIAVTQVGDVWQLGEHRIHCGNALDHAAYSLLMEGHRASVVFSDAPYNVAIDGHVGGAKAKSSIASLRWPAAK